MQLAIRCHPRAPIASEQLEEWLVERVRRDRVAPTAARVLRVSQRLPSGRDLDGWLVEIDAVRHGIAEFDLDALMRDMRLLGLETTVLEPIARGARATVVEQSNGSTSGTLTSATCAGFRSRRRREWGW